MIATSFPRKQRRKAGQLVKVSLSDNVSAVGLVLNEPLIAFFSAQLKEDEQLDWERVKGDVAFVLMVMNHAVTSKRWTVIGNVDVPELLGVPPRFCKIDPITGAETIYHEVVELAPSYERPALPGECDDLEAAAVWEPEHVEDRLRDYFSGVPNKWVEQLRSPGV